MSNDYFEWKGGVYELGLGLKIVQALRDGRNGRKVILRGPYSWAKQSGLINSKRWSKRVDRLRPCRSGWHFWSLKNECIYGLFMDFARRTDFRVYVVQARSYRLIADKAVARQIRFLRKLTPAEARALKSTLIGTVNDLGFRDVAGGILKKVQEKMK